MMTYRTRGTCSQFIHFEVKDGIITSCRFEGGCNGNLQAVSKLVTGRKVDEVIESLKDIKCRDNTSCPAQLALALTAYKVQQGDRVQ